MFTDCLYISSINPILSNSYPNYTIKITVLYIFIHIQHRYLFRYTKQNIFPYTIISYTEFDLFNFSRANAFKGELRSQASVCFIRILPTFGGFLLIKLMDLAGVEPASESTLTGLSPGAVRI